MSTMWVFLGYGISLALALLCLHFYHARAWYWHILSLVCALGMGLMPPQTAWQGPTFDLVLGSVFVFLVIWGIGGLLTVRTHSERHA